MWIRLINMERDADREPVYVEMNCHDIGNVHIYVRGKYSGAFCVDYDMRDSDLVITYRYYSGTELVFS